MSTTQLSGGFKNEIICVTPTPILDRATSHPLLSALLPIDMGWFPHARHHYFARDEGSPEHILIVCMQGHGWYEINGTKQQLDTHEALLIPKKTPHIYGASDEDPWSIHWVHFTGSAGDYYAHLLPNGVHKLKVDSETETVIDQLFRQCYESIFGSFVLQRVLFMSQTLHYLLGNLLFDNQAFSPSLQTSNFHSVESTLASLQENIHTKLTVEQMAADAELSVSHFTRLFKEQTGYSPMEYFIQLKIEVACTKLVLTNQTIRRIGFDLGYDDPYYFSRAFKKITGVSPRTYREMNQEQRIASKRTQTLVKS